MLSSAQIAQFKNFGYVVVPEFTPLEYCESVIALARSELKKQIMPIEYDADTQYPGAPKSRSAEGGDTARRLLSATTRSAHLSGWATSEDLKGILHQVLGERIFYHNLITIAS